MDSDPKGLVERILSSRYFQGARQLRSVLEYLWQRSGDPQAPAPKEWEIAVEALHRPEDFDPRRDPIVRVSVASIRQRLARYFSHEGRSEPLRAMIPKGEYRLVFYKTGEEIRYGPRSGPQSSLERFWQPYLLPGSDQYILFAELLFFHDGKGTFYRNTWLNDPAEPREALTRVLPGLTAAPLWPCYEYISAGEMRCLYALQEFFGSRGVPVNVSSFRELRETNLNGANLILVGSARSHPMIAALQEQAAFRLERSCIRVRGRRGNRSRLAEKEWPQGHLFRRRDYAVVQRRVTGQGAVITVLGANDGLCLQAVGETLTDESSLELVLNTLAPALPDHVLPSRFELLFQIESVRSEYEEITNVRLRDFVFEAGT
ncbi:MAG: hypothetical protein Kow00109_00030 [Acidobacteriota bacterium]